MSIDQTQLLPHLRPDLQFLNAPNAFDGSPAWTLYDPVSNRFFRIGVLVYTMLTNWSLGNSEQLIRQITQTSAFELTAADVIELIDFLHKNQLTIQSHTQQSSAYLAQHKKYNDGRWLRYLNQYLFFRVPLFHPDAFLNRTYPAIKRFCTAFTLYTLIFIGISGIYFVSKQWDIFINTFLHFFTLEGAFLFAVALIGTKTLHEFGHAYVAKHYGCRVPSMGVAFMVMMPMLYTDMTDTWRLQSKKHRIHIAAAGMINELLLAGVCLLLWSFLPDGVLRSICFIIATTSLIGSLIINITPFMRFDGYYILSDYWGIDNLQQRSFQLAKWKLRQLLFGTFEEKPETVYPELESKMIWYAWFTWIYRLVLFLGIALLVYHFFFKLLGIILFFVEIIMLILMPVFKEMKYWWQLRNKIRQKTRLRFWAIFLLGATGLLFFPWNSHIYIPGVLTSSTYTSIYPSEPAQIISIDAKRGKKVEKDQILMILKSPLLEQEINLTRNQLQFYKLRALRAVTNSRDKDDLTVIMEQIAAEASKLEGLTKRQAKLTLRAPFAGVVAEMDDSLHINQWINDDNPVFFIIDPDAAEIKGAAPAIAISRIDEKQNAIFYPEDPMLPKLTASIYRIDRGNIKTLELPYLASHYGGDIAVKIHHNGNLVPETAAYTILLNNVSSKVPQQEIRGKISLKGEPVSFAKRIYEFLVSAIIRESGF